MGLNQYASWSRSERRRLAGYKKPSDYIYDNNEDNNNNVNAINKRQTLPQNLSKISKNETKSIDFCLLLYLIKI
jgi:hypothetical protein